MASLAATHQHSPTGSFLGLNTYVCKMRSRDDKTAMVCDTEHSKADWPVLGIRNMWPCLA